MGATVNDIFRCACGHRKRVTHTKFSPCALFNLKPLITNNNDSGMAQISMFNRVDNGQ